MNAELSNKINILKAVGIIYVIFGHLEFWSHNIFAPYTFHMALFFFISGMVFKEKYLYSVFEYIVRRIKSLLIPYYSYFFVYSVIAILISKISGHFYGQTLDAKNIFITPFLNGHQIDFIGPLWFVPQLFISLIVFLFIQRNFVKTPDNIKLVLYLILCIASTFIFKHKGLQPIVFLTAKTMFSLFFIYLGNYFIKQYENGNKFFTPNFIFSSKMCIAVILLQSFLWAYAGYKNTTLNYIMVWGIFNNNVFLPIISSITGIWFCLLLVHILYNFVKDNKVIRLIGENTYHIMAIHLFIMFIITKILIRIYDSPNGIHGEGIYTFHNLDCNFYLYIFISLFVSTGIAVVLKKSKKVLLSIFTKQASQKNSNNTKYYNNQL